MHDAARTLFRSLQQFKQQPDYLQVWPGHGAGSACGKGLSAIPHSTVGYERMFNWAFEHDDEGTFVEAVLTGQPDPPRYFAEMKRINREGPRVLGGFTRPPAVRIDELSQLLEAGALVVDTRAAAAFASGHIPGTINIPFDRSFSTWAGWIIPYDRDFYLLIDEASVDNAVEALAMIGLDGIAGWANTTVVSDWTTRGVSLQTVPQINAAELAARIAAGEVAVIDVRARNEWEAGRLPGVPNVPLGHLIDGQSELPRERPLVVQCQSGARSSIGSSLLQAHGFTNVINLSGGFVEWVRSGQPVEKGPAVEHA
jgi:hydroxyacylglutathione hydrolase